MFDGLCSRDQRSIEHGLDIDLGSRRIGFLDDAVDGWTVARHLDECIIDGEVVALDHNGAPDFAALQAALSDGRSRDLTYFAFDLLYDAGSAVPQHDGAAAVFTLGNGPFEVSVLEGMVFDFAPTTRSSGRSR